jgi:lactate oxidase
MTTSRRDLVQAIVAGAALTATGATHAVRAQPNPVPPAEIDPASSADRELKIVNCQLLEDEARKVISARRFAFMGPAGDGVTYRENLRAFNDYPIMPRRLQGISAQAVDLRTKLLDHDLPVPIITCPDGRTRHVPRQRRGCDRGRHWRRGHALCVVGRRP